VSEKRIWELQVKPRYTDEQLVNKWLDDNDHWFSTPTNSFFGKREQFRAIAEHWLRTGEHGEDYNDPVIIRGQSYWDDYIDMFSEEVYS